MVFKILVKYYHTYFLQFTELERLGFKGFAIDFCNGKYNAAGSDSILLPLSPGHLNYLHSFIFYGKQFFQILLSIISSING